jgi:phosphatidylserine/phosphatidylglycerophosphate/cardiolipin synthase-like enzyme
VALQTAFLCTLPTKKEIQAKLEETLERADDVKEVSLTGWIDGSVITHLQNLLSKGVHVRLLTRYSKEKGVTNAIQQLRKAKAEVKRNDMVHARMLIVGEREVIVSSADPKASSLVDNREAGICSNNPVVVRAARSFFEEVWNEPETRDA